MSITLRNLILAGLVAEIAFEVYAWFISPLIFGVVLQPANLIVALANLGLGVSLPYWIGFLVHFCVGAIGFSAFVLVTHMITRLNLVLAGAVAGVVLWFVAQGLLAPLVGRTFMMGFGAYTQSSFVGHVGMTLIAGFVLLKLRPAEDRKLAEGLGGTSRADGSM
ncbi:MULTISPECIES: hypothetical protein [unclassified Roseibium]|uniref:hypothetical protein n=1 Tax=unclassified Roseibium TaxID=2629323 RepID=UPI003179F87A